jgi:hypothetical protein
MHTQGCALVPQRVGAYSSRVSPIVRKCALPESRVHNLERAGASQLGFFDSPAPQQRARGLARRDVAELKAPCRCHVENSPATTLQLKSFADFAGAHRDRVEVGRRRRVRLSSPLLPISQRLYI